MTTQRRGHSWWEGSGTRAKQWLSMRHFLFPHVKWLRLIRLGCVATQVFFLILFFRHSRYNIIWGSNLRFEFAFYLNLIPKPQVWNQVQTGFGRFRNQTVASLTAAHLSSAMVILSMLQSNSILLPPEMQMVYMSTVSIFQCIMSFSW